MSKGQGAVEYIIIFGVIILLALVVVGSLGGFGIFTFSQQATQRTTEIINLLGDVGLKYVIKDNGGVQFSLRSQTSSTITAHTFIIENETGGLCSINLNNDTIGQYYNAYTGACTGTIKGVAGESYNYLCTIYFTDSSGIKHANTGNCEGRYERG